MSDSPADPPLDPGLAVEVDATKPAQPAPAEPELPSKPRAAAARDPRDTDAMAAPTEPALDLSPGASLVIKRATLMHAEPVTEDEVAGPKVRNIESYVGFIVDGRYHIESVIAQGGMGVVYFARHRLIDKPVALKILRPELVNNREITARFLTEAQAASAIGSEHIVDITDYGELPDGATYIVMEYLDGFSLNQRIRRCPDGLLPIPTILAIAREIAEGLQRAHDANIVHRDLKPDNVLLIRKGKHEDFVKILDFGIAKVQSSQNQTTTAGRIFGTPHYMSPEQGRGDELDHRTDIYSLGVILYEMVAGRVPFDGENPLGILTQHMYVEVKSLTSQCDAERVTPALECVVARCLMKDPKHRYASMAELDEDLRRLQDTEPPLAWQYFQNAEVVPEYLRPLLHLKKPRKSGAPWGALSLSGAALGAALVFVASRNVSPPAAEANLPVLTPSTAEPNEPTMTVNLAAEPIDAHVFRGREDLGQIPILIQLRPGQKEHLTLRRAGYKPYPLEVDGSRPSYAIRMERVPGPAAAPAPPPAASAAPPATRVVDLRVKQETSGWTPYVSLDAGTDPDMFDEVFREESPLAAPGSPLTGAPNGGSTIVLPPQNMDPLFAPLPPGPPPGEPPGPNPGPDDVSPAGAASLLPTASSAPPGPPAFDD